MPQHLLPAGGLHWGSEQSCVPPRLWQDCGWDLGDEAGLYWSLQHGGKLPRRGASPPVQILGTSSEKGPPPGAAHSGTWEREMAPPSPSSCSPPTEQRRGRRGALCPTGSRLFPAVWPACVHVFVCLYTHVCARACSLRCTSLCTSEFWLEPLLVGHRSCHSGLSPGWCCRCGAGGG